MGYDKELAIAKDAVMQAAKLCEAVRRDMVPEAMEKSDKSPVTVADYGSQAIICRALSAAFPNDPVVGEEDAADLRTPEMTDRLKQVAGFVQSVLGTAEPDQIVQWIDHGNGSPAKRFWTLDPIDGTKGFLRGDQYAIALALIEDGDLKVGLLGCPALSFGDGEPGLLFTAVRGEGTYMQPISGGEAKQVHVVQPGDADRLRFVESVEASHGNQSEQEAVAKAVGITQSSVRMDSQAKYGAVAAGEAALYLRLPSPKYPDYREKIWDHAAGAIVVEEAGGRVTDMHGKPLDFYTAAKMVDNRGVVVSNGAIHDDVMSAL
ncbi:3'(2'),5'-bisphosphate nucleotidase [Oscillatoria sp. CS-180]|uniref:3'(2'),5'-bisphosphate nucleotidase n=1 Tax=Oscillatoria sp. CS-180 TaxID=3021720 RepID=UPI00232AC02A|nr:3'(2'),5'-bisphosphate nucleotidase [Oscillatoria sp. CS-180]MDB9525477.1 3'(2'),5'-bisphosphate nucleotidase [Oscillatoria sp. CS-180]